MTKDYRHYIAQRPALPPVNTKKRPGDVIVTNSGLLEVQRDGKFAPYTGARVVPITHKRKSA